MKPKSNFVLFSCVLTSILCRSSYAQSTTVRPYQFGFTIDEQQHRFEKRDERGIVMGEFGFITADGIYHVTVYATDEQGRFRILAMKNYPYQSPPKTIDMMIERKLSKPTTTPKPTALPTTTKFNFNFEHKACSGCFLKNNPKKPSAGSPIDPISSVQLTDNKVPKMVKDIAKIATNEIIIKSNKNLRQNGGANQRNNQQKSKQNTIPSIAKPPPSKVLTPNVGKVLPNIGNSNNRTPSLNKPSLSGSIQPSSSSSASGNDGAGDLYRFKYILDYNGHTETGSRNGNKRGSFYSIGDDNIERTIEYIANEFGYQPRIRWRKISPNEIKSKENTLKEYEFVWFKES